MNLNHEQITVTSAAVKRLSPATYEPLGQNPAQRAIITVVGGALRFRKDGTDPTAGTGHLVEEGGAITLDSYMEIQQFKAIATTATDSIIDVSYSNQPKGHYL